MRIFLIILTLIYIVAPVLAYPPENDATYLFSSSKDNYSSVKYNPVNGNTFVQTSTNSYTNTLNGKTYYQYSDSMVQTSTGENYIKLNNGDYIQY